MIIIMMNKPSITVEFTPAWQALLAQEPAQWRLAEAALAAATLIYPQLPIARYLQQLDQLGQDLATRLNIPMTVEQKLAALHTYLFDEQGFRGNRDDYFDPRNSCLNDVLDRKLGIPISLAILYLDLAEAIGLEADGIGFPGHFLVGVKSADRRWYIDVFDNGRELQPDDLKVMLASQLQNHGLMHTLANHLKATTPLQIIVRLLRNLKKIYIEKTDTEHALRVIAMILSLLPDSPDEIRDRGMVYQHIDYSKGALEDLTHYLQLVPDAQERALLETMLESLQTQPTRLH
jgi:regulator of sirC expression with transglutaminase-like and TPR domain